MINMDKAWSRTISAYDFHMMFNSGNKPAIQEHNHEVMEVEEDDSDDTSYIRTISDQNSDVFV